MLLIFMGMAAGLSLETSVKLQNESQSLHLKTESANCLNG